MSAILRRLRGGNLEVLKFTFYLFFPLTLMLHFGDPEWYSKHVTPYKDHIFPPEEKTIRVRAIPLDERAEAFLRHFKNLPTNPSSLREELAKIRARKLERLAERETKQAADNN